MVLRMRALLGIVGAAMFSSCATTSLPFAPSPPAAAASIPAEPVREPAGYREVRALGARIGLPDAELFCPQQYEAPADGVVPLYLHFQGGAKAAAENFSRMHCPGVLIASTLSGRSGAFAAPYRDRAAFAALLAAGEHELTTHWGRPIHFGSIVIAFWSAGYGAVRELLKDEEWRARIVGLVSADSIYASVVAASVRAPNLDDIDGFVRFAQAAARGDKVLVLAFGQYQTEYASTKETATLLCASVAAQLQPSCTHTERGLRIANEAHVGGFHCYEFGEATAGIHVDLLYFVPEMVRRHLHRASR